MGMKKKTGDPRLTYDGRIPMHIADRWSRWWFWLAKKERVEKELGSCPGSCAALIELAHVNKRLKRFKAPAGWTSWHEVEAHMIAIGQYNPTKPKA